MKKIKFLLFFLLLTFLFACNNNKPKILLESNSIDLFIGQTYEIKYELVNAEDYFFSMLYDKENKTISLKNETIYAMNEGTAIIDMFLESDEFDVIYTSLEINVSKDNEKPIIIDESNLSTVSWGGSSSILSNGIKAIDNIDGDISDKIRIKEGFNSKMYKEQEITYLVSDSSGNETEYTKKVNVIWDYKVKFIGHAGSYYGVSNSEEAILYAIEKLQYPIIEVDLKQTKDGVFVLCHDDTFGDYIIQNTNYEDIKDVTVTVSRNSGFPSQNGSVTHSPYTAKLCTLERLFDICKKYNVIPLIELKGSPGIYNSDQSKMANLMEVIKNNDMLDKVMFLASAYNCLIWLRDNGYNDIPCQFLVGSCENQDYLDMCIRYNFDISINTTYGDYSNSVEWIEKYHAAGLKVSSYTYTQYSSYNDVQEWIDKGVDFVTCDWHEMDKLKLPK